MAKIPKTAKKKTAKAPPTKIPKSRRPSSSRGTFSKSPQTMEELLAKTANQWRGFKRGDKVEGIVTEKTKRAIYIDIGGKTEGMVIDREMKAAKDYIKHLNIGEKVIAVVTQLENEKGQTILSLKQAAAEAAWAELEEKLKTGEALRVKGTEVNKGGLIVDVRGLQGFVPASQFGAHYTGRIDQLVNQFVEAKLIELDREKNRIILSEKEVSESELLAAQEKILKKISQGDVFDGEVVGVMPFGLFVRVATAETRKKAKTAEAVTLEGLVHISEISWEKVDDPKKFYKPGDKVKVKVLAVDKKSGRLNLSIKQLQPDPWENIKKEYPPDSKIKVEVVRTAPFGVFAQIKSGVEGLVHISKIPSGKIFKPGDKIDCYIESIDIENRRLSLGLVLKEKPIGYK